MSAFAIGLGLFVAVAIVALVAFTTLYLRSTASALPDVLRERRDALRARLVDLIARVPDKAPLESPELPDLRGAGGVEAKLLARDMQGALAEAERVLAGAPDDPRAHVLLAHALVHADQLDAARAELDRARNLGGSGPLLDYLDGRTGHLRILRKTNATNAEVMESPVPALITPFEMFILQLERQRRVSERAAAVWLANAGDTTLDHDQILALVTEHFSGYYDSLDRVLAAAEAAPGFADALYHAARLALKVGFIDQGRELMDRLEPLMAGSPERSYYERDLAQLRDEELSAQVSSLPAVSPQARRSLSLKILQ